MTTIPMTSIKLLTSRPVPMLELQTLSENQWKLADRNPPVFTMIVFYRGIHCPFCKAQLIDLDRKLEAFLNLGIETIAISGDNLEKAQKSYQDWNLQKLNVGYGLSIEDMRRWGLYISKGAFENEPAFFNEPGIFLIKPDRTLTLSIIGTTPFARPHFDELINGIDYILKNNYPTRGTEI